MSCNSSERWQFSLAAAAEGLGLAGKTAGATSAQALQLWAECRQADVPVYVAGAGTALWVIGRLSIRLS